MAPRLGAGGCRSGTPAWRGRRESCREQRCGSSARRGVLLYLRRPTLERGYVESPTEQLTLGTIALRLVGVLGLVLANAFFVAAEFALVSSRRSRIDALAAQGDRSARLIQQTLDRITRYISATQLGITLTSLGLGWIGEATLASLFDRALAWAGYSPDPTLTHSAAAVA